MIRSFKLKIALSSTALSSALLAGFGVFSIQTSHRVGLDRIDRELRALVDADMRKVQPPNHWGRFDESLKTLFGDTAGKTFLLQVRDEEGRDLFSSETWATQIQNEKNPPPPPAPALGADIDPGRERPFNKKPKKREPAPPPLTIGAPEYHTCGTWRVMAIRNPEIALRLAINLEPFNAEIHRQTRALLLAGPIALAALLAIGWTLARLAMRPVNAIAQTAKGVTASHLDQRVPADKADREFQQLIDVINGMLARLESSFQQATRFSADAAHELKTPLTILQGRLESALQTAADGSADQRAYKEALDEVQRLKSIIRKLLLLSQADAGRLPLHAQTLDLSTMIEDLAEDIGILNPESSPETNIQPDVMVRGDAELLTQVIQNLASNAVKYSRGEPPIILTLKMTDQIEFTISNRGETIPSDARGKIFQRFYRVDEAHGRDIEGSGLGLSLAREIAIAHGGTLELATSSAGETTFRLTLPRDITEP